MGITNGPPSFVRAITSVLKLPKEKALIYFDDILTLGMSFQVHLNNLLEVLDTLMKAGLKLKASKCRLFATSIEFLGHIITEFGITCSPDKIKCIKDIPIPKDPKSLRSFLGIFSYYRRFIKDFSKIATKLFKLAVVEKKDFKWNAEVEKDFLELKEKLIKPPILTLPQEEDNFIITCDGSGLAIGCILTVDRKEGRKVIAYASHVLEKSRQSYGATKKEFYAVVFYTQYFKRYLLPKPFVIETDHKCLQFISSFKDPPALIARWIAILADYQYTIVHKPGTNGIIKVADALSRPSENLNTIPLAIMPNDDQNTPQDYTKPSSETLTNTKATSLHNTDTSINLIQTHEATCCSTINGLINNNLLKPQHICMNIDDIEVIPTDKSRQENTLLQYTKTIADAQNKDKDIKKTKKYNT